MTWGAPVIGALFSNLLAMGPLAAVLGVRKAGAIGEVNPDPFPVLFANCIAWSMYGAASKNHFLLAGNLAGVIFGLFYILSTYGLGSAQIRRRIELITFPLFALVVFTGFAVTLLSPKVGEDTLGYVSNALVFVVFSSPLSTAAKVVATKNSASINRPFGIIQVLNCFTWAASALFINDIYLLVPNVFGLALGIIQVVLMVSYPAIKADAPLLAESDDGDTLGALEQGQRPQAE